MGGHMRNRDGLPGRQRGELRGIAQTSTGGVRGEGERVRGAHGHLAPDPRADELDGLPWS